MGCLCTSDPDTIQNNQIDKEQRDDRREESKIKKILFLGSGGSGKSTIFKQLRFIHGDPLTQQERRNYVQYIHEQVIGQMKHAIDVLADYQEGTNLMHENHRQYVDEEKDTESNEFDIPDLSEQGMMAAEYIQGLHHTQHRLNDEIVAALTTLWDEPAIKKMYEMRNITNIEDSSAYFWDMLDDINDREWLPDQADTLLVRHRTTGVTEKEYEMKNERGEKKGIFKIVDVGGQKSERKKWIKCFDSVTAVIFVASLSCYDEVLFEDYTVNAMTDQLELFDSVINNEALMKTSMILFLNKQDLFADKIPRVPVTKCLSFGTYNGDPHDYDKTTKYIRKAFTSLNNSAQERNIFTHVTQATDQGNIHKVFADVQHIVIEKSLMQAGLMDFDDDHKYNGNSRNIAANSYNDADPETAKVIRDTIKAQSQRGHRPLYSGSASTGGFAMNSISMINNFDFRERIKRNSIPHIRTIDYLSVLPQYEYRDNRNVARFTNAEALMKGLFCWAISTVPPNVYPSSSSSSSTGRTTSSMGSAGSSTVSTATVSSSSSNSNTANDGDSEQEMYLMVDIAPDAINSGNNARRRRINLAVVLDVGQSMNSFFTADSTQKIKSQKLEESKKVIVELLRNELSDDDRFCLVWFDDIAKVFQPMVEVGSRNMAELSQLIMNEIKPKPHSLSSTRVDHAGYQLAVQEFRKLGDRDKSILKDCENRIIMISALTLNEKTIENMSEAATVDEVDKRVYSTFICNRHDRECNWDQVQNHRERVYTIPGCNYFTLNSSEQLQDRLVTRFEETVTPLMFNLSVTLEVPSSNEKCVDSIYRLNEEQNAMEKSKENKKSNEILSIRTLFANTKSWDDEESQETANFRYNFRNQRYQLLVRLKPQDLEQREFKIVQSYESRHGEIETVSSTLALEMSREIETAEYQEAQSSQPLMQSATPNNDDGDYFDNKSIRKAILLSRYIRILRDWIENDRRSGGKNPKTQSQSIVSAEYQSRFEHFTSYFQKESDLIDDEQLKRDLNVLKHLFKS